MTRKITLPKTAAQADKLAGNLHAEATEREWSLAALIYAQVLPHGKRKAVTSSSGRYDLVSTQEYALRGIRGLTSKQTVVKYRATWKAAIDAGIAQHVSLGDKVELPDADWHDYYPGDYRDGTPERHVAKKDVEVTPEKIAAAIKSDPAAAITARDAIEERDAATELAKAKAQKETVCDLGPTEGEHANDLVGMVIKFRKARKILTEILGEAVTLKAKDDQTREIVSGNKESIQAVLDAIEEVVEGRTFDEELAELLDSEV